MDYERNCRKKFKIIHRAGNKNAPYQNVQDLQKWCFKNFIVLNICNRKE